MEKTHERFIPTSAGPYEIKVNLDRYIQVMPEIAGQSVIELGCGTGLGTYLYSLVAKSVLAVDYDPEALAYADAFPFDPRKVSLHRMDLEKEYPEAPYDVAVAVEVLEHLSNPEILLSKLDVKKLVFSLPFHSIQVSTWHKYSIRGGDEGLADIRALIEPHFTIERLEVQEGKWVFGVATSKEKTQ